MYAQKLINIPLWDEFNVNSTEVISLIKEANILMCGKGRVLIRPSGTQPVIRIMTEGPDRNLVDKSADFLAEKIKDH
jgi:phosphoglucosamine mutase